MKELQEMHGKLIGKTAIVTGAGAGIGRGSAIVLAGAGARVVVGDIDDKAGTETVRRIEQAGGEAIFVHVDVAKNDEVSSLIAQAEQAYGGLDIMFANAGITHYIDLEEMDESQMDRVLDINLKGALLCAKYSIPAMKKRGGGSIVFCSSVLNTIGFPQCVVYSATKAGMVGTARTLAVEIGKHNIRVNCVSPGTINTPMLARDVADMNKKGVKDYLQNVCQANALGRVGEPEDVGNAVVWLCSDEAGYVTGQNLYIDGAFTAAKKI
jgi:NAD(P)-dependent dehydrogenase (short-subunit alcohol dehydrogenase family)